MKESKSNQNLTLGRKNWCTFVICRMNQNINTAKTKSIAGIWSFSNWLSEYINKTTGYDQITEIERTVNEQEKRFEETTKRLRELNIEYLVMILKWPNCRIISNV